MSKIRAMVRGGGICLASLVVTGWFTLPATSAQAAKATTVKVKTIHQVMAGKIIPAADGRGHFIGVVRRQGNAVFADGRTARYDSTYFIDGWRDRKIKFRGHSAFTFQDWSKIFLSWTATWTPKVKPGPGGAGSTHGKGVITGGTGKYKGIKGRVEFSVRRERKKAACGNRVSVTQAVLTYTLP